MADVLLWQRYDNKMVAMRYYSTSSTVQS